MKNIWISFPSIQIPPFSSEISGGGNQSYDEIFRAYSHNPRLIDDGLNLPRSVNKSSEGMAAEAIAVLLEKHDVGNIDYFVDCRSSTFTGIPAPTYKLAKMVGLTSSVPFSLSGQYGTEVSQALFFLNSMGNGKKVKSIISATQRIDPLDKREIDGRFPLADGTGAIIVSSDVLGPSGFQILAIDIGQTNTVNSRNLEEIINRVCFEAGIDLDEIVWSISPQYLKNIISENECIFPFMENMVRNNHPNFDFGCTDSLISLDSLVSTHRIKHGDIGIIWDFGRYGGISAILLSLNSEGHEVSTK